MDVRMPGMDGVQATARITADHPDSRVLILTTFDLDEYAFAGLRAGASGFLLKDVPPDELISAIRSVATGDAVVAPGSPGCSWNASPAGYPTSSGTTRTRGWPG